MPFRGHHSHTLDKKGRVSIPVGFRTELQSLSADKPAILTRGEDHLVLYPEQTWAAMERDLMQRSHLRDDLQEYKRLLIGGCWEVPVDGQGRVLLPQEARDHAELGTKVTLLGMVDSIEIWDTEVWEESQRVNFARLRDLRRSVDEIPKDPND